MFRSIKDLLGYPVVATDGKAGKVADVLFGDLHWRMRFLDVDTHAGFHFNLRYLSKDETAEERTHRPPRVLVSPEKMEELPVGLERRRIPLRITQEELRSCPSFVAQRPVEEQFDYEFRRFFRHAIYDDRPPLQTVPGASMSYTPPASAYEHTEEEIAEHLKRMKEISGEHVHSARSLIGYRIRSEDENLGYVSDIILDTEKWQIADIVLDTRHGLPSKRYLVSMDDVLDINWSEVAFKVKLSKEEVKEAPRFWPYDPVNNIDGHEYDYYGKPCLKELMADYY